MWKKAIPNTLYTIAIVLCLIFGYQDGWEKRNYVFLIGAIVLIVIFIRLKIKILKEINKTLKKP
jgi:hypothetical protein